MKKHIRANTKGQWKHVHWGIHLYWTHWVLEQAGSSAGPARTEWIDTGPPHWPWTPSHYRTQTAAGWWYWTDTELRKAFTYVLQLSWFLTLINKLILRETSWFECMCHWEKKKILKNVNQAYKIVNIVGDYTIWWLYTAVGCCVLLLRSTTHLSGGSSVCF